MTVNYPDITPIFAAKQRRRQELAALSWEEKVAIIEKMRQLLPRHQWRKVELTAATVAPAAGPAPKP
ncbi:MAG: hypothetical protein KAX65_08910 [Caldilineaceae bacterium]|nr:hypothetical protein [Caldilineaceae bacterium]